MIRMLHIFALLLILRGVTWYVTEPIAGIICVAVGGVAFLSASLLDVAIERTASEVKA